MRASRAKASRFLIVLLGFLLLAACEGKDTNRIKAYRATGEFHAQFNASRFTEIYAEADPRLRQSVSEADFISQLEDLQQRYGAIRESGINGVEEMTWWQRRFPNTRPIRYVAVSSKCERGRLQEFFDWDVSGEAPRLLNYRTEDLERSKAELK